MRNFIDHTWILYLARIDSVKGQQHAIRAWNALSSEKQERTLLIFLGQESASGQIASLKNALTDRGRTNTVFPGASMAPRDWIAASDAFLSLSEFEGMPLAPLESIGSGLPALLSEIPGHEFLKPFANLVDCTIDDSALADSLAHLI